MSRPLERSYTLHKAERRDLEDGRPVLEGYAAVYNRDSNNLGGFIERIAPGAFDQALGSDPDVLCRVQHLDGLSVIGRTRSGTLELKADEKGLHYTVYPPDTQAGRDIVTLVTRGDIDQSSFAFNLDSDADESWDFSGALPVRTLYRVNLFDVAPVSGPAYNDTSVHVRSQVLARALRRRKDSIEARRLTVARFSALLQSAKSLRG